MLLERLVVERTIVVIVHFITPLLLDVLTLLALAVNLAACVSAVDDITQVSVFPIMPSAVLLWWSETAGRVSMWTMSVVKILTLCFIVMVENWVNHGSCV
jgi:hypothetical protein